MVKTKRVKYPYLWLQSVTSTVQPVTVLEALYVLSGKRTKLHDNHLVCWFILYHISSSQAFYLKLLETGTVSQAKIR